MIKQLLACTLFVFGWALANAQAPAQQKIFTSDIDHFWTAFDSVQTTTDTAKKMAFIQSLYIDKGSVGLKSFMLTRNYNAKVYLNLINKLPKFWASVRPNTLKVLGKSAQIEKSIKLFKMLYPELKDAKMYFTIGGLRSGGTTTGDMVLIGTEIAAADAQTDVSEFTSKWLPGVFKVQSIDNLVYLNVHEYVHTQQIGEGNNLLAMAIAEGSCDFIAELVTNKPLHRDYITYGLAYEATVRDDFKTDMFGRSAANWLGNGSNAKTMADLGYFMGYQLCKAYYSQVKDKKQAIKDIIQLNYADDKAVEAFLQTSKYYKEGYDKEALTRALAAKQPSITGIEPFANGNTSVDSNLTEMLINFSAPMGPGVSINFGRFGKTGYPVTEFPVFTEDKKNLILKIKLQPAHEYEFEITTRSFASADGYPLDKSYTVYFKTK
ncbi:hypothetical protein FFF34_003440 [Inquilinus sp. KBS0705]|nr:hypothetical protein FFF34_003440 [Inquilinus sp. KBS0705]